MLEAASVCPQLVFRVYLLKSTAGFTGEKTGLKWAKIAEGSCQQECDVEQKEYDDGSLEV